MKYLPKDPPRTIHTEMTPEAVVKHLNPKHVTLLMGLPGSGKSTLAEKINQLTGRPTLSLDLFRFHVFHRAFDRPNEPIIKQLFKRSLTTMLSMGIRPIIDATNLTVKDREERTNLINAFLTQTDIVFVNEQTDRCQRRIKDPSFPATTFSEMVAKLKPPTFKENFAAIVVYRAQHIDTHHLLESQLD